METVETSALIARLTELQSEAQGRANWPQRILEQLAREDLAQTMELNVAHIAQLLDDLDYSPLADQEKQELFDIVLGQRHPRSGYESPTYGFRYNFAVRMALGYQYVEQIINNKLNTIAGKRPNRADDIELEQLNAYYHSHITSWLYFEHLFARRFTILVPEDLRVMNNLQYPLGGNAIRAELANLMAEPEARNAGLLDEDAQNLSDDEKIIRIGVARVANSIEEHATLLAIRLAMLYKGYLRADGQMYPMIAELFENDREQYGPLIQAYNRSERLRDDEIDNICRILGLPRKIFFPRAN